LPYTDQSTAAPLYCGIACAYVPPRVLRRLTPLLEQLFGAS
jgi:hypothetical protein